LTLPLKNAKQTFTKQLMICKTPTNLPIVLSQTSDRSLNLPTNQEKGTRKAQTKARFHIH